MVHFQLKSLKPTLSTLKSVIKQRASYQDYEDQLSERLKEALSSIESKYNLDEVRVDFSAERVQTLIDNIERLKANGVVAKIDRREYSRPKSTCLWYDTGSSGFLDMGIYMNGQKSVKFFLDVFSLCKIGNIFKPVNHRMLSISSY